MSDDEQCWTFDVWRTSQWRCEYQGTPSGGTLRLYMGGEEVASQQVATAAELYELAMAWWELVRGQERSGQETGPDQDRRRTPRFWPSIDGPGLTRIPDRRENPFGRRAANRGGRRVSDSFNPSL